MKQITATGQTVKEAVESALAQLNTTEDRLEITIVDEGKKGVFGIFGSRPAVLDASLRPHIDREVSQIDPIERAALRLAAYELGYRPDVPYRVVINEAIEVTKRFGADHGHSYVNGVLDKLAAQLRAVEKRG